MARDRVFLGLVLAAFACRTAPEGVYRSDTWRGGGPSEVLSRFLDAAESGDFDAAYQMMSGSWRARYTPERLKQDFAREPLARERLARARAALSAPPLARDGWAEFPIGDGKSVRLIREEGVFRVVALE